MSTTALTATNFADTVEEHDIILIDFWAEWCGPCKTFGPIYEKAAERHDDVVFGKVDTESEQALAAQFGIMSIPTLMAIREKVVVFSQPGVVPEDAIDSLIEQVRALDMDEVRSSIEEEAQQDG